VVHRAFTGGLDLAYLVAAGFGLIAAVAVFTLVRRTPRVAAPATHQAAAEPEAAPASVEA
jgi:hypothetical protein